MKNIEDAGYFEGDTFVFDPPIERRNIVDGVNRVTHVLDFSEYEERDGITKEDIVHAILNQIEAD